MNARVQAFERETFKVLDGWRAAPPVTVVASPADLPCWAPDDVRGLYMRGEVFVVAQGHPIFAPRVIAHEAVAHHGLRVLLGNSHRSFLSGLASSNDADIAPLREHVRWAYDAEAGGLKTWVEADEIAAAVAERMVAGSGHIEIDHPLRRRAAAAVGHFAREFLHMHAPVSHDQLLGALLVAQGRLKHGGRMWGVVGRAADWYSSVMTKPWHEKPLISVQESEEMLRAEQERLDGSPLLKLTLAVLGLLACVAVLGWQLLAWVFR